MPQKLHIICDIAGRIETFKSLLTKLPPGQILSVGDMVDRGPGSKQVLDWFMAGNGLAIKGNHEDMFLDFIHGSKHYGTDNYLRNGGGATLKSFGPNLGGKTSITYDEMRGWVPAEYVNFLANLPYSYEAPGLLVTHAPLPAYMEPKDAAAGGENVMWNRNPPKRHDGILQVFGHNWQFERYEDANGLYAMCIDSSGDKKLTCLTWPDMTITQVDWID